MKKWILRVGLFISAISIVMACSSKQSEHDVKQKIGILQYIEHNALDAVNRGFVEELKVLGYEDGKNIVIQQKNASGDQSNLQTIAEKMVSDNDVILAIATPAAQAVAAQSDSKPILFTAVTDPISAELVESMEKPGANVTGTSDQTSVNKQVALLKKLLPQVKKVGILYTTNERNSEIQSKLAKDVLEQAGYETILKGISHSNDVQDAARSILSQSDAVYITTDNVISSTINLVVEASLEKKVPVFGGSETDVKAGVLFSYGTNYDKLGRQTAHLAVKVLKGEKVENIPAEYPKDLDVLVNEETAKAFQIDTTTIRDE
ncbi:MULTISPECIES: ABC transporter substrate-binding protein [unclassified Granulicatella]|uniref:ABC transporter substrate-binding protein n=1 Tax=unclassified Granulicatella TaxID=2630493 RepID=UPI001D168C64|nr:MULTISPECIES: ABC transporter substrate-binding protein [unclassified Granulicatella]